MIAPAGAGAWGAGPAGRGASGAGAAGRDASGGGAAGHNSRPGRTLPGSLAAPTPRAAICGAGIGALLGALPTRSVPTTHSILPPKHAL